MVLSSICVPPETFEQQAEFSKRDDITIPKFLSFDAHLIQLRPRFGVEIVDFEMVVHKIDGTMKIFKRIGNENEVGSLTGSDLEHIGRNSIDFLLILLYQPAEINGRPEWFHASVLSAITAVSPPS